MKNWAESMAHIEVRLMTWKKRKTQFIFKWHRNVCGSLQMCQWLILMHVHWFIINWPMNLFGYNKISFTKWKSILVKEQRRMDIFSEIEWKWMVFKQLAFWICSFLFCCCCCCYCQRSLAQTRTYIFYEVCSRFVSFLVLLF